MNISSTFQETGNAFLLILLFSVMRVSFGKRATFPDNFLSIIIEATPIKANSKTM